MAQNLQETTTDAINNSGRLHIKIINDISEDRIDFLATEDVMQCKVKEEIAAESLILSSLSGTVSNPSVVLPENDQENKSNKVLFPEQDAEVSYDTSELPALSQNEHNYGESVDLANIVFEVPRIIDSNRIELVAVQQSAENSESKECENETSDNESPAKNIDLKSSCDEISTSVKICPVELIAQLNEMNPNTDKNINNNALSPIRSILCNPIVCTPVLTQNDVYPKLFVCTTAQEAHELIKKYAEETMSTFVSMRKMKQFGITEDGIDMTRKNYRVFFESADVEFDGIPYVYIADKMYICHLGKDKTEVTRQKIRQQSLEKRAKLGLPIKDVSSTRLRTKKIDCPVKITVKMIAKFPQFKVNRKTKRVCETASKKVRQSLSEMNGKVSCYFAFVGRLPGLDEHNHIVGEANSEHEPIDTLIKDKIIQLTWEGTPNSNEVKKKLDDYVECELFAGKSPPSKSRRRYYPSVKDIRNYMNKAKMLTRLSSDIRDELQELANKLQTSRPTENIILQSECAQTKDPTVKEENEATSTLIFCHQTSQQQRLLRRYGNQVILCEISNCIQRVPFPLFCLFVQTNVDHQLVACFVLEVRNQESIVQGLNSIKEWNPTWTPKYVTIDYSEEQNGAVELVFPGCGVFISDASRERDWRLWLSNPEHYISRDGNQVFNNFQALASAYNECVLREAALQLENSDIWREKTGLRSWFYTNWLQEAKKWVAGYRPDDFIVTLHNESLLEQDINSLREAHIHLMRGKRLGSLINKLVDRIIPDFYRRYVELNRKSYTQANELKVLYEDQLPTCLVDKPASVIIHVLSQIKSTESAIYNVSHIQPGVFWIQDASNVATSSTHVVSFGHASNLPSCDCASWQQFKLPCKHMCSVFSSFPDWGWDMLNVTYTSNPLINLDYSCIKPWVDVKSNSNFMSQHSAVNTLLKTNYSGKSGTMKQDKSTETSEDSDEFMKRKDLVLECQQLLGKIGSFFPHTASDDLCKLKVDLLTSVESLKKQHTSPTLKRHALSKEIGKSKKLKIDLENSEELDESSEEEFGILIEAQDGDDSTEIGDETVEIITEEEKYDSDLLHDDVPITVLDHLPTDEKIIDEGQSGKKLLTVLANDVPLL